ncbi:MAG: hypothetical protein LAQ69_42030 [Acidobacteriia bacterium]|nr:hypothetical protein [Terriglobia bacterium]
MSLVLAAFADGALVSAILTVAVWFALWLLHRRQPGGPADHGGQDRRRTAEPLRGGSPAGDTTRTCTLRYFPSRFVLLEV